METTKFAKSTKEVAKALNITESRAKKIIAAENEAIYKAGCPRYVKNPSKMVHSGNIYAYSYKISNLEKHL